MTAPLSARAPAKINLSLHVVGRRHDGWHELASLVAFAGAGDLLTLDPDGPLSLLVRGPTAHAAGATADNLVLKAARALADRVAGLRAGAFVLTKRLPVAAGLGGGSSDAAAALRLLARSNELAPDDPRIADAARSTGADVPVCLEARARMMRGTGDVLGPALVLPTLPAVLVNPGVAVPTPEVFRALALAPGAGMGGAAHPPDSALPGTRPALVDLLAGLRNDLEPAARALAPEIGEAMRLLAATRGARLARMSGSGATVYCLFDTCRAAARAAAEVRAARPRWWVKSRRARRRRSGRRGLDGG